MQQVGAIAIAGLVVALSLYSATAGRPPGASPSAPAASASEPGATESTGTGAYLPFAPDPTLLAAAINEGTWSTIGLPHNWCNYGESIETFKSRTGLDVGELDPEAVSDVQVQAIVANKGNSGPQAPDVIDVGRAFARQAQGDSLLQPYQVSTWETIPEDVKDADGYWYGDVYGVVAFEINSDVVANAPTDWSDLLKPENKGQVALGGNPRASTQAIRAVYAAALANGGSFDDAQPGLDFFKQLKDAGNLTQRIATAETIAAGEIPIAIRWTFDALANRDVMAAGGPRLGVVVPANGRIGTFFTQGINAFAPHPNAAKLWMKFIYSDDGQAIWLKGNCHPVRYQDLVARDVISADRLAALPNVDGAVFPTLEQLDAASTLITENWDSVVGLEIK